MSEKELYILDRKIEELRQQALPFIQERQKLQERLDQQRPPQGTTSPRTVDVFSVEVGTAYDKVILDTLKIIFGNGSFCTPGGKVEKVLKTPRELLFYWHESGLGESVPKGQVGHTGAFNIIDAWLREEAEFGEQVWSDGGHSRGCWITTKRPEDWNLSNGYFSFRVQATWVYYSK